MAVGLSPESWALLALCGVLLNVATSMLAIEPGLILMPLLAMLLPRLAVTAGATIHIAIATTIALLVPLSIGRLGLLRPAERKQIVRLAPAVLAGAFFGGSLMPFLPGPFLLAGFATLAAITLMHRPRKISLTLAVAPPARGRSPFAAILKCTASSLFGIGLPLSEGRNAEKAVLTLFLSMAGSAGPFQVPSACQGCTGLVFMPALIAIAAGAVLTAPLWAATFGESYEPRLRPVVMLAAAAALLAMPIDAQGEGKTALAALAPGLCPASPAEAITLARVYHDPLPALARRFGPRRGLADLMAGRPSPSVFIAVAQGTAANPQNLYTSGWITMIENQPPQKPKKPSAKRASNTEGP